MGPLRWVRGQVVGLLKRVLLALLHANDPWDADRCLDVTRPALRRMIARARLDRRREAGAMICWSHFRDRVAEQRELREESEFMKKKRLARARLDKIHGRRKEAMRFVV